MAELHRSPKWDLYEKMGVAIYEPRSPKAELRNELHGGENNILNKTFTVGGKRFSYGQAFERAASTVLNRARLALVNERIAQLEAKGKTWENAQKEYEDAGRMANELTGHGKVADPLSGTASELLNPLIWSMKMWASTANTLGVSDIARALPSALIPKTFKKGLYGSLSPASRVFLVKKMGRFIGVGMTMLVAAKAAATLSGDDKAEIDLDPLSPSFGSIKYSNGRTWSPFGRYSGMVAQLLTIAMGKRHIDGKDQDIQEGRASMKMVRGHMTPLAGTAYDLAFNDQKDSYTKLKLTPKKIILDNITPMSLNDFSKDLKENPDIKGAAIIAAKFAGAKIGSDKQYEAIRAQVAAEKAAEPKKQKTKPTKQPKKTK